MGIQRKQGTPKPAKGFTRGKIPNDSYFFSWGHWLVDDCYETCIQIDVHKAYNKSIMLHYPHQQADRIDDGRAQWILHYLTRCTQKFSSVQSLSHVRLCDPMNRSTPGLPVHHKLPEITQIHIHRVSDAIQPPHPLSSPSPPGSNSKRQL